MCMLVPAKKEHLPRIMEILNGGREFQREQGFVQWPDGYPPESAILEDIAKGTGYVLVSEGTVACYLYLGFEGDPAYPEIKGAWHFPEPYVVIHRMAVAADFRGTGVVDKAFALAEEIGKAKGMVTLRIDTDGQNKRMQRVLERNGYGYCGTVIQGGGDRMAFDKSLV